MLRFARFIFGALSGPFMFNATVKHHMKKYKEDDPEFANTFLRSIFVDDLSARANTDEEAHQMYIKSKLRLAEGGFFFGCYSVCETMKDTKEGYFIV